MQLQLKYNPGIHLPTAAAFVKGGDAYTWLKEISRWNLSPGEMELYIIPMSIRSVEAAGMFVVFKDPAKIKGVELLEPFGVIQQKLFIPIHSELVPAVSAEEWKGLLVWDCQVLHPSLGFTGFERNDQLDPKKLFTFSLPLSSDWSFAHHGLEERPGFQRILIVQPSAKELMNSLKEEIGQKSIEDIPHAGKGKPTLLSKITDKIKMPVMRSLLFMLKGVTAITGRQGSGTGGRPSSSGGIAQKMQNWLEQNIKDLEERRNNEIQRLLKLFDKDNNEALQYAIPLNSPYFNRGTGSASYKLTRRPLNFNWWSLGGGGAVDAWDIGDHYNDLRTKYLQAAQNEIERKDFKKAAYIHAHLLGDFTNAANCLEQGGLYREAAVLYKDHLKNLLRAAECLEKGHLYSEAIELYDQLNRHEKIGDLYTELQQQEKARVYYEKYVATKIVSNDYLDAARVLDEKVGESKRARQTLLDGWNSVYQPEPCLRNYFDILLKSEKDQLETSVKQIYLNQTPSNKKINFLNVLEYVHKKKIEPEAKLALQEIAYEILYEQAESGNTGALSSLQRFFPGDKLISSDSNRYRSGYVGRREPGNKKNFFYLDQNIKWVKAVWHRSQFLVLGLKDGYPYLARANSDGNVEYYSWEHPVPRGTRLTFVSSPYISGMVILHSSDGMPITKKILPRTKYFSESLTVDGVRWMHKLATAFTFTDEQHITMLESSGRSLSICNYTLDGNLKSKHHCNVGPDDILYNTELVYYKHKFYTCLTRQFVTLSKEGELQTYNPESNIRLFGTSQLFAEFFVVVSTNSGCMLFSLVDGLLSLSSGSFAASLIPSAITFVSSRQFVMVQKNTAHLFEIKGKEPTEIKTYEATAKITSVLPGSARNQFILLEESGKVTKCDMEN